MRKIGIIAVLSLMALALAAVPAMAAAPNGNAHFIKNATSASVQDNNLVVNFKETGLSAGSTETLTLSATGTATYQCFNNGGNHPKAGNKETVSSDLSKSQPFTANKNGNLVGTITLAPPGPGDFSCPPGQTLVGPTNVSYTDIVLSDATSGASIQLGSAR